jgi:hypothetical protein
MEDESKISQQQDLVPDSEKISRTRTTKQRGESAEIAFLYKASNLGFGVAKPYGDSDRYDFILSWDERLWRVQVKSTTHICRRGLLRDSGSSCPRIKSPVPVPFWD